jgi:hypothetical protein
MSDAESRIGDYRASHGGPFFELQRRLGMLRENAMHAGRRAAIFVTIAWGVPLLLSLVEGHAFGPKDERPFLLDFGSLARFFIAVGLFLLSETEVENGLRTKIRQFVRAPVLAPSSFEDAADAVATALKRRSSSIAEIVCLAIAILGGFALWEQWHHAEASTWAAQVDDAGAHITFAGWWAIVFSAPIFYFLLLRGLWRYIVWALLLWRISRLDLRLVASHPDGKGGLGFVAEYPNAYALFVFGVSSAAAIVVVRHVFDSGISSVTFGYIISAWLAIVLVFFGFPLIAFTRPLGELKRKALEDLGAQATVFHRQAERALLGHNLIANDPAEATPVPPIADPSGQYAISRKFSIFLLSRTSLIPIAAAALVPFAIAGATKLPYKEVFALVKKLLVI